MIIDKIKRKFKKIEEHYNELLWARIWEDTCKGIRWLDDLPGISPGRWAVGYNYIYALTRILDVVEPHHVLDLGLGISSTLISNWFNHCDYNDAYHIIVEQDDGWKNFYLKKNAISSHSEIVVAKCVEKDYKGFKCLAYEDFNSILSGKKFSVISIDGPWGSKRYSRRDIVPLLPDILEKDFVIIMDDTDRKGEEDTVEDIMQILDSLGIKYEYGSYSGMNRCTVICSQNYRFLCSM